MAKLRFRTGALVFATLFTGGSAVFLHHMALHGEGRRLWIFQSGDGISTFGWVNIAILAVACVLLLPHALQGLLGRPAIEIDDDILSINVYPLQRIRIAEIEEVVVTDDRTTIFISGGKHRKINSRLLEDYRTFFFDLSDRIPSVHLD